MQIFMRDCNSIAIHFELLSFDFTLFHRHFRDNFYSVLANAKMNEPGKMMGQTTFHGPQKTLFVHFTSSISRDAMLLFSNCCVKQLAMQLAARFRTHGAQNDANFNDPICEVIQFTKHSTSDKMKHKAFEHQKKTSQLLFSGHFSLGLVVSRSSIHESTTSPVTPSATILCTFFVRCCYSKHSAVSRAPPDKTCSNLTNLFIKLFYHQLSIRVPLFSGF